MRVLPCAITALILLSGCSTRDTTHDAAATLAQKQFEADKGPGGNLTSEALALGTGPSPPAVGNGTLTFDSAGGWLVNVRIRAPTSAPELRVAVLCAPTRLVIVTQGGAASGSTDLSVEGPNHAAGCHKGPSSEALAADLQAMAAGGPTAATALALGLGVAVTADREWRVTDARAAPSGDVVATYQITAKGLTAPAQAIIHDGHFTLVKSGYGTPNESTVTLHYGARSAPADLHGTRQI